MIHEKHMKAWGYELWIVNRTYCGKILHVDAGGLCSLHYHKRKHETFYLQSGRIMLIFFMPAWPGVANQEMAPGDSFEVPPRMRHRFVGVEESDIIEFSTHHDEKDSYRLTESRKAGE